MIQALVIGLLTLCAALIFLSATPPGAAPDELSHFIRVGGLASGSVFGTIPDAASFPKQAPIRAQNERIRREAGTYVLSPRFNYIVAVGGACNSFKPQQPACNSPTSPAFNPDSRQFTSLHARTQPLAYVLPAIASKAGWSGRSTFFLARLAMAIQCSATIAVAWWLVARTARCLGEPIPFGTLGPILIALTPLTVSFMGVLAPSALEVCAALGLTMSTWALVRHPCRAARVVTLMLLTGAMLSRSIGVAYGCMALLGGTWAAGASLRALLRSLQTVSTSIAAAVVLVGLAWDPLFKANLAPTVGIFDMSALVSDISNTWLVTAGLANGLGWIDVALPTLLHVGFLLVGLWVVFASCVLGTRRWSRRVVALAAMYLLIGVATSRGYQPTGGGMQSRFLLAGWATIIAASGLHLGTLGPSAIRRLRSSILVTAWLFSVVVAGLVMVRRHEVGSLGPIWFLGSEATTFRPFGGYIFLGAAIAVFVALGVVVALAAHVAAPSIDLAERDQPIQTGSAPTATVE